jgi:hypothetical protein
VSAAIKQLDKLEDDRTARVLRDGGKALLDMQGRPPLFFFPSFNHSYNPIYI